MTFAVAAGGRVNGSFVARLPRLAAELGPVAAQSYRLASRIVNSIGAGAAVRGYEDLNDTTLILISAPLRRVAPIVAALAQAVECRGKIVLLCDGGADSRQLAGLQAKGAEVGSIQSVPGSEDRRFVAEGDRGAIREAKRLVRQLGGRLEEVATDKMALYAAGLSFGTSLFTPLLEASLQCLQDAGMPKASAMRIVEELFQSSLRGYLYAGKRSWAGPLASGDRAAVEREQEALAESKPVLARLYREAASLAQEFLGKSL